MTTLDLHANITSAMAAEADAIIGFDTYPHVDCYERGLEAVRLIRDTAAGTVSPETAYRQLPLLTGPPAQCTMKQPMSGIVEKLHALESRPGVLTATLSMGFPFADIRDAGASVLVAADGDRQLAGQCAEEFARYLWERRAELVSDLVSVEEAIARSRAGEGKPFVLAEGSDNPGGGGPCDGTHVLRAFLEAGVSGAVDRHHRRPGVGRPRFPGRPRQPRRPAHRRQDRPPARGAGGSDGARQADLRRPLPPQGADGARQVRLSRPHPRRSRPAASPSC